MSNPTDIEEAQRQLIPVMQQIRGKVDSRYDHPSLLEFSLLRHYDYAHSLRSGDADGQAAFKTIILDLADRAADLEDDNSPTVIVGEGYGAREWAEAYRQLYAETHGGSDEGWEEYSRRHFPPAGYGAAQ